VAYLIAGLGNPGPQYQATRHNVGFWFIDALAARFGARLAEERRFGGALANTQIGATKCWLFKPGRFMNRNGGPVAAVAHYYRIELRHTLLVFDDIDLPAGRVRLRASGGHGGHNGMRDVIAAFGTPEFPRLRFGVGHPGDRNVVVNHVLGRPGNDDRQAMEAAVARAVQSIDAIVCGDIESAQNELHGT